MAETATDVAIHKKMSRSCVTVKFLMKNWMIAWK